MAVFKSKSETSAAPPQPGVPAAQRPAAMPRPAPKTTPADRVKTKNPDRVVGAQKIKKKELPAFSRQISAMLLSGMPLIQSLDALEDQASDKNFKMVILGIKNYLQSGSSFSEALGHYPSIFDSLYINMIRAGESGGQLGETAARLASFLESAAKLSRKVKSAMAYPVIVLCIAILIAIGMILFIVPIFSDMYADFHKALPGPTQFLVDLSHLMKKYGIIMLGLIIVLIIAFHQWKKTASGGFRVAQVALNLPVLGELNRKVASSRFARTFAQLLKSGVPILRAMEIVSGATGNKVFEKVILESRLTVERGEPLSGALLKSKCFPRMLVHMMSAGEKIGKVDEMLENIAGFYDDEVTTMLDGLTSLIEPLLMVFLGVIIGGIVISMFLPIFKMGEVVGG